MSEQRCGTCRHFTVYLESNRGKCGFPVPYWIQACLRETGTPFITKDIAIVMTDEGYDCPTYEAKP